jgi:hypothetical protein
MGMLKISLHAHGFTTSTYTPMECLNVDFVGPFQDGGYIFVMIGLNFSASLMQQPLLLLSAFFNTLVGLVLYTNFALTMVLTLLHTLLLSFYLLFVYNIVLLWLIPKKKIQFLNA